MIWPGPDLDKLCKAATRMWSVVHSSPARHLHRIAGYLDNSPQTGLINPLTNSDDGNMAMNAQPRLLSTSQSLIISMAPRLVMQVD